MRRAQKLLALYLALGAAFVLWIGWEGFRARIATFSPRSDFWEHAAVMRALLDSPWHPANPQLKSAVSSPRFGPQFVLVALLTRPFHGDALDGMGLASILNALLLLGGIYAFFKSFFRDPLAPVYGLIVMLGAWWDAWVFSNVYQLRALASVIGYPSGTALGLTLLGFALTLRIVHAARTPARELALLGALTACIVVVHPLTAVLSLTGTGLLTLTEERVTWRRRGEVWLVLVAGTGCACLWPYFSLRQTLVGGGEQEVAQSRPGHRLQEFYNWRGLANALGLALFGVAALPYFLLRKRRLFVGLGALSMLVPFVINIYVDLPLGHRFVLLAMFYLHVAVVWLLLLATPGSSEAASIWNRPSRNRIAAAAIILLLGVFTLHNVKLAAAEVDGTEIKDSSLVQSGRAIRQIAGADSVVITDTLSAWPIPAFGPKVVTLYHANPLVLDAAEREHAVRRFFGEINEAERLDIVRRYQVTHVLARRAPRGSLAQFLRQRNSAPHALPNGYTLYAL